MNAQQLIIEIRSTGITQVQLSKLSGLSQSCISDLENGKRGKRTSHETMQKLQEAWLELSEDENPEASITE